MKTVTKLMLVIITLLALLASASTTFAEGVIKMQGKVTAISDTTLTIQSENEQSHQVMTNSETKFRIGKQQGSLTDIKIGDLIGIMGKKQDDGAILAKQVIVTTGQQGRKQIIHGEVLSIDTGAGTLTVQVSKGNQVGEWLIKTTPETKYHIPKVDNPTLANIEVGSQVKVMGKAEGDSKSVTALSISMRPKGGQKQK